MTDIIEYQGKKYVKCDKDDLKFIGTIRNECAKPSNFAMLYSGGVPAVMGPLLKTYPDIAEEVAISKATKALQSKKGVKNNLGRFEGGIWSGAFNHMMDISLNMDWPEVPILKTKITTALKPEVVGRDFITGRMNYAIQATGSEFLSAIITMTKWLCYRFKIDAQFVISIHDELAWIVPNKHVKYFVVIFQIAHLYTWALFMEGMGMNELPLQRAFFSGVAVDDRVRKSAYESTITISNPNGGDEPNGKEYTMLDLESLGWIKDLERRKQLIDRGII